LFTDCSHGFKSRACNRWYLQLCRASRPGGGRPNARSV
jgi:hypothetical protein